MHLQDLIDFHSAVPTEKHGSIELGIMNLAKNFLHQCTHGGNKLEIILTNCKSFENLQSERTVRMLLYSDLLSQSANCSYAQLPKETLFVKFHLGIIRDKKVRFVFQPKITILQNK